MKAGNDKFISILIASLFLVCIWGAYLESQKNNMKNNMKYNMKYNIKCQ